MGIAHICNQAIAEAMYRDELSVDEKKLIAQGKSQDVQDARNEIWTPGVESWLESLCRKNA